MVGKIQTSSSSSLDGQLQAALQELKRCQLDRTMRRVEGRPAARMTVDDQEVWLFSGANYLDLAGDPRVMEAAKEATAAAGCAAGGARLISGNLPLHEALEEELAEYLGFEATLLFSTGYMANLGALTALAGPDDLILSDELNHASIIDACRLSHATCTTFRHNDLDDFRRALSESSGFRRTLVVVDGVYSMDGDTAPLNDLIPLAHEYEAIVVVDDAHGCGVLGETGRGTCELHGVQADVLIGNLGKAFGSFGGFIACSATAREYLVNCCRTFIFTCGLPPATVAAARTALRIVQTEPQRREDLLARSNQLRAGLRQAGYDVGDAGTHIIPAIVGSNERAIELCDAALDRGVYAQAIRFPSVPEGTARLRFAPMASHTPKAVEHVISVFAELKGLVGHETF